MSNWEMSKVSYCPNKERESLPYLAAEGGDEKLVKLMITTNCLPYSKSIVHATIYYLMTIANLPYGKSVVHTTIYGSFTARKKKVIFNFRCLNSQYTYFFFLFPFNISHTSKHWLGYLGVNIYCCCTKRKTGNYQFQVCQYTYFLFFSPSMCLMHIQVKLYIVYDIYIVYLYTIYNSRSFFLQLRRYCHAGKMSI